MAKRIKVSGKPPRGLSKAERVVKGADATFKGQSRLVNNRRERENYKGELVGIPDRLADSNIETLAGLRDYAHLSDKAKRGQTKPSSTRKKLVKEGSRKFIGPQQPDPASQLSYATLRKFARENPDLMEPRGSVPRTAEQLGISRHKTYRGSKKIKGLPETSIELEGQPFDGIDLSNLPIEARKIGDPRKSIASERLKRKLADFISRMKVDF